MTHSTRNVLPLLALIGVFAVAGGALMWWRASSLGEVWGLAVRSDSGEGELPKSTGPRLRIAMSAAFVSEQGVGVYEQIAAHLTRKTGMQAELVRGLSYGTINSMLEDGTIHCGFIGGLSYTMLRDRPQPVAQLLVAPAMKAPRLQGQPKYFSDLIVHKDSPFQTLQDLEGRTLVYNEELSNSGYNMPRYHLLQLGKTNGFFGKVLRSGSHEESIRMVAAGEADASFIDSLVLDHDREKGIGHAHAVRVIESLGPAGINPVVASTKLPEDSRLRLQDALARMHEDPEGRRILDKALVDRFVVVDDSNYDDIRAMKEAAERAGYTVIR